MVVLQGGKSVKGARAAMSHTASLAGNARIVSGALAQAGAVEARDFKQLVDFCRTLASIPPPPTSPPGRIAVLTFSGGAGILAADFMDEMGLSVADLSPETLLALGHLFPDWMPVNNPVDIWPAVEKNLKTNTNTVQKALRILLADDAVDGVLLLGVLGNPRVTVHLSDFVDEMKDSGKPVLCSFMGNRELAYRCQVEARALGLLVYPDLYRAVECMALVFNQRRT
jgi:acetyltransferase